jgi:hypothetical protein
VAEVASVHDVRQAVGEAQVKPPVQGCWVPGVQALTPSHFPPGVNVLGALQDAAAPHGVFAAVIRQPLLPLQVPSSPQAAPMVHSLSGSAPAGMGMHCPFGWPVFALAHELQTALHMALQQKPSKHWPDVHSFISVQVSPLIFFALHRPELETQ